MRNRLFLEKLAAGEIFKTPGSRVSSRSVWILQASSRLMDQLAAILGSFDSVKPDDYLSQHWRDILVMATHEIDIALGYSDDRWTRWLKRHRTVMKDQEWAAEFRTRGWVVSPWEGWLDPDDYTEDESKEGAA